MVARENRTGYIGSFILACKKYDDREARVRVDLYHVFIEVCIKGVISSSFYEEKNI